jgi:ribonuclease HI
MKYYAVRKGHHPRIIAGEWAQVEPEIKKEISGFRGPEWKGFPTRAQAEAYMAEREPAQSSASTVEANREDVLAREFQFTADAVIFVDGSRNFDNVDFDHAKPNRTLNKKKSFYFGSYGIIIFFRDGSV